MLLRREGFVRRFFSCFADRNMSLVSGDNAGVGGKVSELSSRKAAMASWGRSSK